MNSDTRRAEIAILPPKWHVKKVFKSNGESFYFKYEYLYLLLANHFLPLLGVDDGFGFLDVGARSRAPGASWLSDQVFRIFLNVMGRIM